MYTHTPHTHTHTCITHAHVHIRTHTHVHNTHTYINTHTHTHTYTNTHTYKHAHACMHKRKHKHTAVHTQTLPLLKDLFIEMHCLGDASCASLPQSYEPIFLTWWSFTARRCNSVGVRGRSGSGQRRACWWESLWHILARPAKHKHLSIVSDCNIEDFKSSLLNGNLMRCTTCELVEAVEMAFSFDASFAYSLSEVTYIMQYHCCARGDRVRKPASRSKAAEKAATLCNRLVYVEFSKVL